MCRKILFCLAFALALTAAAKSNGFYVWQRVWTPEVTEAVKTARAGERALFVLAGELEVSDVWARVNVPEEVWRDERVTAVLRAPANALEDAEKLRDHLQREIAALKTTRVQLDVDVPERKLADYATLLKVLREALPMIELSVTLLPAHLERNEVAAVVREVDYFVVQVHGIEAPRHREEGYALMKRDVARRAVERAKNLGKPFAVALPTYAYVLTFDNAGKFRRLYAEGFPGAPKGMAAQVAAPDLTLLAEMLDMKMDVVWFRLPVAGDRWALDMETIRLLENGEIPTPCLELTSAREEGRLLIRARFRHQIPLECARVTLRWRDAALRGEFFSLNGTTFDTPYGTLPESMEVSPHACGQWFPVAFAYTENELR